MQWLCKMNTCVEVILVAVLLVHLKHPKSPAMASITATIRLIYICVLHTAQGPSQLQAHNTQTKDRIYY